MISKAVRLSKALGLEFTKRLPYIVFVLIILLVVQFIRLNTQTAEGVRIATSNSIDSKSLLRKVAALSEDNKRLNEQNNRIAKENSAHLNCVAELFAKYTRDQSPVLMIDLDTCFIQEVSKSTATASLVAPQLLSLSQSSPQSFQSSSPEFAPSDNQSQSNNQHPSLIESLVSGLLKIVRS